MYRFLLLFPGSWVKTVSSESRNERLNMLFHCVLCKCMVWIEIFPSIWTQKNHKYLAYLISSVRTVCYGTSFFSARISIRAEKTRSVINSTELEVGKWKVCITSSRNIRASSYTGFALALIKWGHYFFFWLVMTKSYFKLLLFWHVHLRS